MPKFVIHDEIAEMMGVPRNISEQINRFIDDINPPSDFEAYNIEERVPFGKGKRKVSIRVLYWNVLGFKSKDGCLHDRCKDYKIIRMDLKWMLETGRIEYIKPYFLHFIVDYINDRGMPNETASDVVNIWEKRRGCKYTIPDTESYLKEVLDFVINNSKIIDEIVHPFKDAGVDEGYITKM